MSRVIVRTVVMAVVLVLGTAAGAAASGRGGGHAREVELTTVGPEPGVGTPLCSPEGQCIVPVPATSTTVSGGLTGAGYHAGTGALLGEQIAGTATSLFVGSIDGCGTGAFVVSGPFTGTLGSIKYGKGKVLLGTGDFEGMTGSTVLGGTSTTEAGTVTSHTKLRIVCPE